MDAVFIDGDHTAYGVMSDYARYEGLVGDSGVVLFHDSVWEGTPEHKGSADALCEIDKLDPVYLVDGDAPPRRFIRPMFRNEFWGVVGVVFASEQLWRNRTLHGPEGCNGVGNGTFASKVFKELKRWFRPG